MANRSPMENAKGVDPNSKDFSYKPDSFGEDAEYVLREFKNFATWIEKRIDKLEQLTGELNKCFSISTDSGYHAQLEAKIDRMRAKLDADFDAQNGAVTGSQLDTDYSGS